MHIDYGDDSTFNILCLSLGFLIYFLFFKHEKSTGLSRSVCVYQIEMQFYDIMVLHSPKWHDLKCMLNVTTICTNAHRANKGPPRTGSFRTMSDLMNPRSNRQRNKGKSAGGAVHSTRLARKTTHQRAHTSVKMQEKNEWRWNSKTHSAKWDLNVALKTYIRRQAWSAEWKNQSPIDPLYNAKEAEGV